MRMEPDDAFGAAVGDNYRLQHEAFGDALKLVGASPMMAPSRWTGALPPPPSIPAPPDMAPLNGHVWRTDPYAHQRVGVAELLANRHWGLFWEMGCIAPDTMLRCEVTGRCQSVKAWHDAEERPILLGYNRAGALVRQRPSRLFLKAFVPCRRFRLADGRETTVGDDHFFLVRDGGGEPCLHKAKTLGVGMRLATSGGGGGGGTTPTSSGLNQSPRLIGWGSSSETVPYVGRGIVCGSSWALAPWTLPTWTSSLSTLAAVNPHGPNGTAPNCAFSGWGCPTTFCGWGCPWTGRHGGGCPACQPTCGGTSGGACSMLTARSVFPRALTGLQSHSQSPFATRRRRSLRGSLRTLRSAGLPSRPFSGGTTPGSCPSAGGAIPSGSGNGCTVMLPDSLNERLNGSLWPGVENHFVPTCCAALQWAEITAIDPVGVGPVYDLSMDGLGNYFDAAGVNHQNTGKSKVICDRLRWGLDRGEFASPLLIVCPRSVMLETGWPAELEKHAGLPCWILDGSVKKRLKVLDAALSTGRTPVLVLNFEGLLIGDLCRRLTALKPAAVIVDEVQRVKDSQSKTARALRRLAEGATYRWALSGTPAPNGPQDFFGSLLFLDPTGGVAGTRSKIAFRSRYCILQPLPQTRGVSVVVGHQNLADLSKRVAAVSSRVKERDCLDLPPLVHQTRTCELTGEQARVYKDLRSKAVALLTGLKRQGVLTAQNVLTESLRLLQCCGGFLKDDLGHEFTFTPNAKLGALSEFLDDLPAEEQVIIWCAFRPEIAAVKAALTAQGQVVEFHGGISAEDRQRAITAFQGGRARFFVGTAAAGGLGITLTAGRNVVYYSRTWNLGDWLQSQKRSHRIGQDRSVLVTSLLAAGTIDTKIDRALTKKATLQDALLAGGIEDIF